MNIKLGDISLESYNKKGRVIFVTGLPGSGKTSFTKHQLVPKIKPDAWMCLDDVEHQRSSFLLDSFIKSCGGKRKFNEMSLGEQVWKLVPFICDMADREGKTFILEGIQIYTGVPMNCFKNREVIIFVGNIDDNVTNLARRGAWTHNFDRPRLERHQKKLKAFITKVKKVTKRVEMKPTYRAVRDK